MWQHVLHNALGQFITKCVSSLQNADLLLNEMTKLLILQFGLVLHNARLVHNAAQQGFKNAADSMV